MAEKDELPVESCFFVDRRKTGGQSSPNRQRLLHRIKSAIGKAKNIDLGNSVAQSGTGSGGTNNPITVSKNSLHEPTIHYDMRNTGQYDIVYVGNDKFERGDLFDQREEQDQADGSGEGEASVGGEDTEDSFEVRVSREEFFNVYFEDRILPNFHDTNTKVTPEVVFQRAGFQRSGNNALLSIVRSYQNSFGRRFALGAADRERLDEIDREIKELDSKTHKQSAYLNDGEVETIIVALMAEAMEIERRLENIPFFDDVDLRFVKREKIEVKKSEAVFMMLMDVSGSMDEERKTLARRFFALQYAFIKRKHPDTELIFIAHTDKAEELTEDEFFTTRLSGGTMVSSAFELAEKIIVDRYDTDKTNIYVSHASDGDNWYNDNHVCQKIMKTLLPRIRYFVYVEISSYYSRTTELMELMRILETDNRKICITAIKRNEDVYSAFDKAYPKVKHG